ncbi:NAD(P)H-dependent oxidoreductase [Denitrobaculum tricleocarpae]|uniref:NAD(P)H-dependent oxidoreductase n=1 Tax=Denitrobaculum tricleocarpae TaxID=2591009 RepID=A0A545U2Z9_9PROT|nr:NAD(P)H-dependent oxidoreductase [Denitrobaculum tricleocarpae]TQV83828.1 NAD(P)H-dependent oxidoreductase [Denitrobaculum tricleocarpae]
MRLLTVFAHPFQTKYPSAVMNAFHTPLVEAGYDVDILDLHQEGFDPRFTEDDHAHFWGGPVPPEIAAAHQRVNAADRLAFVFPVYWWGMPALMKGWIERVFTQGWAYKFGDGVEDRGKGAKSSLLGNKPTVLIGIAGSKQPTYEKYGYDVAMRTQIDVGTFAYCGIADVESHLIFDVEGDHNADKRDAGLSQVREVATAFIAPKRVPRDAKAEHLHRTVA